MLLRQLVSTLSLSLSSRQVVAAASTSSGGSSAFATSSFPHQRWPTTTLLLGSSSSSSPSTIPHWHRAQPHTQQVRHRTTLTPRRSKYRKAHKGRVPVRTGGSTSGTTLEHGDFGIRVNEATRLSAKQLHSASEALRRGIKPIKGARLFLRVFPDIPVCVKGNETRMGKGKGTFEFWACRAPVGKVIFEVGGGGIAEQVAKDALRLASAKLPVTTEFVTRASLPRVGSELVEEHYVPHVGGGGSTASAPAVVAADSPVATTVLPAPPPPPRPVVPGGSVIAAP